MECAEVTTLIEPSTLRRASAPTWQVRSGLHFGEVESILDSLDARGVGEREVEVEVGGTFRVRWVPC